MFHNPQQNTQPILPPAIPLTITLLLTTLLPYIHINITPISILFVFLIPFLPLITLPLSITNNLNHPPFNKNTKQKLIFIPSFKNIIFLLFSYF
ncbi:DUF443 family protein, partial [Staphylococcus epidermidis]|uniref:DUF443 family protein n=1 Tax=Staphylococcus epidermidis TaxID=1282 RepID=UPI0037DA1B76